MTQAADLSTLTLSAGYWYLATPYSKFPAGIDVAFREACRVSAWLIGHRVPVFCPIAHTHPIALFGEIDPLNHDIWLPADKPLMEAAHRLIVCMMPTWKESHGIAIELAYFTNERKPVRYLAWPQN